MPCCRPPRPASTTQRAFFLIIFINFFDSHGFTSSHTHLPSLTLTDGIGRRRRAVISQVSFNRHDVRADSRFEKDELSSTDYDSTALEISFANTTLSSGVLCMDRSKQQQPHIRKVEAADLGTEEVSPYALVRAAVHAANRGVGCDN